jgi:hypothetical protein
MNDDLKENLPLFLALAFGGLVILGLAGTVLYLQFRSVARTVQSTINTENRMESTNEAKTAATQGTESIKNSSIVGSWVSSTDPAELRIRMTFSQDGQFNFFILSPLSDNVKPVRISEYKLVERQGSSGSYTVIAFYNSRTLQQDGTYLQDVPNPGTDIVSAFNLRVDSTDRICTAEPAFDNPSSLREDQWQCLSRVR